MDRDGKLSLDEFIDGCLRDEYLSNLFKTTFLGGSMSYAGLSTTTTTMTSDEASSCASSSSAAAVTSSSSSRGGSPSMTNKSSGSSLDVSSTGIMNNRRVGRVETKKAAAATRAARSNSVNDTLSTISSSDTHKTAASDLLESSPPPNVSISPAPSVRHHKPAARFTRFFHSHNNLAYLSAADDELVRKKHIFY